MTKIKNVTILGDSIFRGVVIDNNTKRYTFSKNIDWEKIEQELNVKITNLSKFGSTIKYGYEKLSQYLNDNPQTDIIVVEYGGNDSDYDWEKVANEKGTHHVSKTELDDFEKTLNDIIDLIKSKNIKPIISTLPPINSTRYFDWITKDGKNQDNIMYFIKDKEVIYRRQEMFNAKVVEVANARGVELVDIRGKFLQSNNYLELMCEDGIHPNCQGANLIVQCFLDKYR
ncbi:MAG: SGNH/GDSL hydrolase family protein [Firmicutes bacterium]|nr:SGNH/GDSL hydrolase family protein [Bacillota bacterium]